MTLPGEDADRTNRERSAAEVDAEFAAIISGISPQMSWSTSSEDLDAAAVATAPRPSGDRLLAEDQVTGVESDEQRTERERRRAARRAQRAEEVALYEAGQAQAEAELQADDAHFVPPEPPPVPRPRRRTVVALLFLTLGLLMLINPGLFQVGPDAVRFLGIVSVAGGFGLLVHGLRPRAGDPDDADGWDDGARL